MRLALLALLCLFSNLFFSQKLDKNYHLKHTTRQGEEQFEFTVLDFENNGVYAYDKSKFYYWLKTQEVHSTQGYSSGLLLHGEFKAFHKNKQLSQRGFFQKGLKNGEWLYWNRNGVLICIEHWRSGEKYGIEKRFNDDGNLIGKTKFKRNKQISYYADSIVSLAKNGCKCIKHMSNGKINSIERTKSNTLHGKQEKYKDGKLIETTYYENGKKVDRKTEVKPMKKLFSKFKKKDKKPKSDTKKNTKKTTKS